jgi:hypothetical protein
LVAAAAWHGVRERGLRRLHRLVAAFDVAAGGLAREDGNRGDLFAVVQLSMPTAVGPDERVLWEKIAALSTFDPRRSP